MWEENIVILVIISLVNYNEWGVFFLIIIIYVYILFYHVYSSYNFA